MAIELVYRSASSDGAVKSVNGKTGAVVLTAEDVGAATKDYVDSAVSNIEVSVNGLTTAQISALEEMFKVCAFIKDDVSAEYNAFKEAFGSTGSGEEPDDGEDTHTHSYTSTVTTEPTCSTDGIRTYTCDCGSSYTETIAATGEHNYVDGVCSVCGAVDPDTESGGEDSGDDTTNNGWTDGVAYSNYNWTDDMYIHEATGVMSSYGGGAASDYMPCDGVVGLYSSIAIARAAFYDADKNYISKYSTANAADIIVAVPENAAFFRVSTTDQTIKEAIIIPYADLSHIGTEWEDGVAYTNYNWIADKFINKGTEGNYSGFSASGYMPCNGAATLTFSTKMSYGAFYDVYKAFTGTTISVSAGASVNVPEGAVYFRVSGNTADMEAIEIVPSS